MADRVVRVEVEVTLDGDDPTADATVRQWVVRVVQDAITRLTTDARIEDLRVVGDEVCLELVPNLPAPVRVAGLDGPHIAEGEVVESEDVLFTLHISRLGSQADYVVKELLVPMKVWEQWEVFDPLSSGSSE